MSEEMNATMESFEEEINRSFKKLAEGDIITGTVIGVTDTCVNVDLGYYTEGIVPIEELSNDPKFSIKQDILVGDTIKAMVLAEDDGEGNISLSIKKAIDVLAWETLKQAKEENKIYSVKIAQTVNAGVVTYLEGIRAFIPASQLSLSYVENLDEWVGKTIDVKIITAEEAQKKLVLSGKEVERARADRDRKEKISSLQKGIVTTGTIETLMPYGCFVNIGDGLSGLVHISQICGKHIKHPGEIVKEGQEVKVKIIDVKDGKISLSMKAVEEKEEVIDDIEEAAFEYHSEEEATTGLGALLKGIKLN
ncbi:MAG: small subunit ribosomal protein [Clostridiales bacterium]|nr:small subunit ribosomal protein [Clostridiales bacterium]